jgi:hypothetical protein
MGYQVVDAATFNGTTKRGVAYNAELLTLDGDRYRDKLIMLTTPISEALRTADEARGGASEAGVVKTNDGDRFYRFSAFANDRRVTADNGLLPDTFATTEEDGAKVKTGNEAVERYALPNNDPASYRFKIAPLKDTAIKKGVVQPANGHQGGGIEVIFSAGTTKNTVAQPPTKLPDL